ncbi:hypothetical protein GA0115255_117781 [Streptomyces sp. Ncost-T6T-2b]|nr:hypothetical protein GA0115255_117781 [Streptomyces sp. Ncost-T6T-2b]
MSFFPVTASSTVFSSVMIMNSKRSKRLFTGWASLRTSSWSPRFSNPVTAAAVLRNWAARTGFWRFFTAKITSSAVKARPSWKVTSSRRFSVMLRPSFAYVQEVASSGFGVRSSS